MLGLRLLWCCDCSGVVVVSEVCSGSNISFSVEMYDAVERLYLIGGFDKSICYGVRRLLYVTTYKKGKIIGSIKIFV